MSAGNDASRAAFEAWYIADAKEQGAPDMSPEYMASLRDGDHYGDHRHMLNGKWEGWQASRQAALEEARVAIHCIALVRVGTALECGSVIMELLK